MHHRRRAHVAVDVAAKPRHTGDGVREVEALDHRAIELLGGHPLLDRQDELPQVSSATTGGDSTVRIRPLIRKSGDAPVCKCTSEAPCSTANRINWSKFMLMPRVERATDASADVPSIIPTHARVIGRRAFAAVPDLTFQGSRSPPGDSACEASYGLANERLIGDDRPRSPVRADRIIFLLGADRAATCQSCIMARVEGLRPRWPERRRPARSTDARTWRVRARVLHAELYLECLASGILAVWEHCGATGLEHRRSSVLRLDVRPAHPESCSDAQ